MSPEKNKLNCCINHVIVYQSGAQITQKGSIDLKKGEQKIIVSNLPEHLDKESVRVKGVGTGKIININLEFNSQKEYRTEDRKKFQEEKERLEKEIGRHEKEVVRLNEQIAKCKSTENVFYTDFPKSFAFGEVDMGKFLEFNEKIDEIINSKTNSIEIIEERIKELRIQLQVIDNKIYKLGPVEKVYNFYEMTINLNVIKEGEFTIEIRYNMSQAWWKPFYDISLSEDKAILTMMANVYNRTELDWEDVEIEISTASLKSISLIKPNPMILEERVPYDYDGRRSDLKAAKDIMPRAPPKDMGGNGLDDFNALAKKETTGEILLEESELEIETMRADVSENIGVQSFKIPSHINVPSDENPHPITLTTMDLQTKKKYFWSSAAPENVIIQDKIYNADLLLLAGNVKIYYLDEFLGGTNIPVVAPNEVFKLGTRVSYDLKIDKKLIDRSKDKKAVKGKLKNNYTYKIYIKNLNNVEDDLTIFDRIPHSSSENIKVEINEIDPEPNKKELGVLKWKFNLKGIDEKNIHYKYSIEYKKGISINHPLP